MPLPIKFKFLLPIPPQRTADTAACIDAWQKYKESTRRVAALWFAAISLIILQNSAPSYSLSTNILQDLLEILDLLRLSPSQYGFQVQDVGPKAVKFCGFILMFYIAQQTIDARDPLSNTRQIDLLALSREKKRFWVFPWIGSLAYYARCCPTTRMYQICNTSCPDKLFCKNPVLASSLKNARRSWSKILPLLDSEVAYDLLQATNKCRSLALKERVILGWTAIGMLSYVVARVYEIFHSQLHFQTNYPMLVYIGFLGVVQCALKILHPTRPFSTGGHWHNFADEVTKALEHESFKKAQKVVSCIEEGPTRSVMGVAATDESDIISEYRSAQFLIRTLDSIVMRKLAFFLDPEMLRAKEAETYVSALLASLLSFYYELGSEINTFRACVFLPTDDQKRLVPWKWESLRGSEFTEFESPALMNAMHKRFNISGTSLLAEAWSTKKVVCSDNPTFFYASQRNHLRSIVAVPILCEETMIEAGGKAGFSITNPIGILCVDSNSKVFNKSSEVKHYSYIRPFMVRIAYELIRSSITHWEAVSDESISEVKNDPEKPFVTQYTVSTRASAI